MILAKPSWATMVPSVDFGHQRVSAMMQKKIVPC
jgi:hypothetical protein